MKLYKVRYFFSPGAGVCLWSANDAAREKYDLPVDHWQLPLTENLKRRLNHIVAWYDTAIDWNSPSDPSLWTAEESERFQKESTELLNLLRTALEKDFEIVDERNYRL
jgi:hypothetical protein